jgi:urocanate hydratase
MKMKTRWDVNDPGLGVIRHADAGYDVAKDFSRKCNLDLEERLK